MVPTIAIIPTRFRGETLSSLIEAIRDDVDEIVLLDNGHLPSTIQGLHSAYILSVFSCLGMSIYEMWNYGWNYALIGNPEVNITFLNDDIILERHTLGVMADFLRSDTSLAAVYPDYDASFDSSKPPFMYTVRYTESTAGAGGMTGYCFMIKGELDIPRVDENLKLYWGDDDLVKQIGLQGYKIGRVVGLPIGHLGSKSINQLPRPERLAQMEQDRRYFNQKYGENRVEVLY